MGGYCEAMPRLTDAEVGRRVREAMKGHRLRPRRLFDAQSPDGYLESDMDFLANNYIPAAAILDALAPSTRKHDKEQSK